jgi:hypothetical protein
VPIAKEESGAIMDWTVDGIDVKPGLWGPSQRGFFAAACVHHACWKVPPPIIDLYAALREPIDAVQRLAFIQGAVLPLLQHSDDPALLGTLARRTVLELDTVAVDFSSQAVGETDLLQCALKAWTAYTAGDNRQSLKGVVRAAYDSYIALTHWYILVPGAPPVPRSEEDMANLRLAHPVFQTELEFQRSLFQLVDRGSTGLMTGYDIEANALPGKAG